MKHLFGGIYNRKRVLVTGHTGFKGSWLVFWLNQLGAEVIGYSLDPPTSPNHFSLIDLPIVNIKANICDYHKLETVILEYRPEIIFHLAAQPLVLTSYINPLETLKTNILGTVNLFEACRSSKIDTVIINITSDKCYQNKGWIWGYRENDPLGGMDPYSASKACSELITSSYKFSFFPDDKYGDTHRVLVASCRAGNVIGGGDWAENRLLTDIILSYYDNHLFVVRNPMSTRPWQYVLEPISGYLLLGQMLLEGRKEYAQAWNFGPSQFDILKVIDVVKIIKRYWPNLMYTLKVDTHKFYEADLLQLDSSKAFVKMKWRTILSAEEAIVKTINWYQHFYEKNQIITLKDLIDYIRKAESQGAVWTS